MKVVLKWQSFRFSPTGKQWLAYREDESPLCLGGPTVEAASEAIRKYHPDAEIEVSGEFVYQGER